MKHEEAKKIIQDCLENTYDANNFDRLIANILTTPYKIINNIVWEAYVREAFRESISSYIVRGMYEDSLGKKLAILEVRLRSDSLLQNARTMQRNFVADFLKWGNSYGRQDGALVAFVWPQGNDWRFSLVKMEYSLEVQEGKIKTQENLTPAKRWSFLVGKNEKSHTAQSRFLPLVIEESHGAVFAEIENAFDVESVTDEFFEEYKECFFRFKDEIDRVVKTNDRDRAHFESIGLDTANFAKKTLGQIAFLYFLQKKGWFGIASDKKWWEWPKDFLRKLFEKREKYGKNFFNDVLEPLFYEALATDRWELAIYTRLNNTRVPFLNGGLFEPMKGYEWEKTYLTINDEVFSNNHKTKNGDIGDGIFDVFDRYNFTVSEDEPLEKEVAVDPEMLGKIFENLLEIRDRKSKWAFYTPRPIVHYMCQESLIEYLSNIDVSIPHEDIEFFIRESEVTLENDKTTKRKIEESREKWREYRGDYVYKTPLSIRQKAKELDQALSDIRIADPAVGSGAFPLGMVNEIVRARQILTVHTGSTITAYQLKLHAIQENIYGVDLEPGAVEICQLRLWLSLIVDETAPHPLPNLNYRIMQGNSLIEEYEWIKLYDASLLSADKPKKVEQMTMDSLLISESNRIYELLQNKLKKFINTSGRSEKNALRQDIDALKFWLIEATLKEQNKEEKISEIRRLREANVTPFFLWKLEFSEVFQEKGGFDVVIWNPPYIDSEEMSKTQLEIREKIATHFIFTKWNWDIYIAFFELGLNFLSSSGSLAYITPDKWLDKTFWDALRKYKLSNIHSILKAGRDVFNTAKVDSIVTIIWRSKNVINTLEYDGAEIKKVATFEKIKIKEPYRLGYLFGKNKNITNKIDLFELKLSDIGVCENACATSDAYKLKEIIFSLHEKNDFNETYYKVINTGTIWRYKSKWEDQKMTYLKDKYDLPVVNKTDFEAKFPNSYSTKSRKRKIIIKGLNLLDACLDIYWDTIPGKTTIIFHSESINHLKLALGIINSKLCIFYMKSKYESASYNWWISFTKDMIGDFPMPLITSSNKNIVREIESVIEEILEEKLKITANTQALELKIDNLIYKLYDLTEDEIKVIEES
jgi:hypothetical protein